MFFLTIGLRLALDITSRPLDSLARLADRGTFSNLFLFLPIIIQTFGVPEVWQDLLTAFGEMLRG